MGQVKVKWWGMDPANPHNSTSRTLILIKLLMMA